MVVTIFHRGTYQFVVVLCRYQSLNPSSETSKNDYKQATKHLNISAKHVNIISLIFTIERQRLVKYPPRSPDFVSHVFV